MALQVGFCSTAPVLDARPTARVLGLGRGIGLCRCCFHNSSNLRPGFEPECSNSKKSLGFCSSSGLSATLLSRVSIEASGEKPFRCCCVNNGKGGAWRPDMVDREMLVLRRRIHEIRRTESRYEPPQNWMKWEKDWSATYSSDVCEALCVVQNWLLNTRPALCLGLVVLTTLSIPTSIYFLISLALAHGPR